MEVNANEERPDKTGAMAELLEYEFHIVQHDRETHVGAECPCRPAMDFSNHLGFGESVAVFFHGGALQGGQMTELERIDDKIDEIKVEGITHYVPKEDRQHLLDPDCPCAPIWNRKAEPHSCYTHRVRRVQ